MVCSQEKLDGVEPFKHFAQLFPDIRDQHLSMDIGQKLNHPILMSPPTISRTREGISASTEF